MPRSHPTLGTALFYFTFSSAVIDLVFADGGGHLGQRGGGEGGHHGLGRDGIGGHIHGWDRSSSSSYSVGDNNR